MIQLQAVFVANGAAVLLLFMIIFSTRRTLHHGLLDNKIFYVMICSTILQCIVETITLVIDGNMTTGFHGLSLVLNSLLYINNIVFAFTWTVFADYKLFGDTKRLKRIYPFVGIPAIFVSVCSIINLFTPVFFQITAQNVYQRTGWYVIPYAFTYIYLGYGVILIYRYKDKVNKYLFLPALVFMLPILIGSLLQYFFYGLSLVWIGVAIALVSLYVNVQNEVSYIDTLSGLFTRQYMNQYLQAEIRRAAGSKSLVGIMLDIDRFKSINDSFGHLIGDDAIHSAGQILHTAVPEKALAIRYAGDEFMIIHHAKDQAEIQSVIARIQGETKRFNEEEGKPYQLQFSMGYTFFDWKNDTLDTFLGRMDTAMYVDKKGKTKEADSV